MVRMIENKASQAESKPDAAIFMPNFPGGSLSFSPESQKDRRGYKYRCTLCQCPVLQEGEFSLCLGCAKDGSWEIAQKASVTRFKRKYMLSEVFSPKGLHGPLNPHFHAPSEILAQYCVTKPAYSPFWGQFL